MNNLIIPNELIVSSLTPGKRDIIIIKYEDKKQMFNKYWKEYPEFMPVAIKSLQENMYLKIVGDDLTDLNNIVLRAPAEELFKSTSLEKSVDNILNYLNKKTNKKRGFSLSSNGNRKYVSARLKEGYTENELKSVIDIKTDEWLNTSQEFYLRPQTLFNDEKFQSYINQVDKCKKDKQTINRM